MFKRLTSLCWLLLCFLLVPLRASAQSSSSAILSPPQLEQLPLAQTCLDIRDSNGHFVHGLQPEDITLREDNQSITDLSVEEVRHGTQLVVALNPGQPFAIRNSKGLSRYDYLRLALGEWANNRQGSNIDDWSLVTTSGVAASHVSDSQAWWEALKADQTDLRASLPSLDTLSNAIDLASDPTPRTGMNRAVLLVTAPLAGNLTQSITDISDRANQMGIRIYTWLITGTDDLSLTQDLADLSLKTGGEFMVYNGSQDFPSPELYFEPLRSIYCINYTSKINRGGAHQLVADIQTPEGLVSTAVRNFEIALEPPNPAFISPVLEVSRKPSAAEEQTITKDVTPEYYQPAVQNLSLVIDFPDGRVRPLVRTSLYVDGKLESENQTLPFDRFTWDLRKYTKSASHSLKVEAEDSLGLVGTSMDTLVQVNVAQPVVPLLRVLYKLAPTLIPLLLVLVASVTVLLLILGGQITPRVFIHNKRVRPATEPISSEVNNELSRKPSPSRLPRSIWPQRRIKSQADAYLNILPGDEEASKTVPIPLTGSEITLGSDPQKATLVFPDFSVDALHARLIRTPDGYYLISDEGSVAGTWLNFTPVSASGCRLIHGDLINIGMVSLRFSEKNPSILRKPVMVPIAQSPAPAAHKKE